MFDQLFPISGDMGDHGMELLETVLSVLSVLDTESLTSS